jgi:hypothetical protein
VRGKLACMSEVMPNKNALIEVAKRLRQNNIQFALGGSGLMSFFGCRTEVHDWDLTTDAPSDKTEAALAGLTYIRIEPSGIFATKYLFKITLMNTHIDLMGGFAIKTNGGVFQVPTIVTANWDGIPVGSPEVWLKVYEILGRIEKANTLRNALNNSARIDPS